MTQLIDDQLLSGVLRGFPPPRQEASVFTTGYFYVRLCQAVLASDTSAGVLSGPFASLPDVLRERAIRALLELPEDIGLVSLRELAPVIGRLRRQYDLNILGIEVLAAAVYLDADVYLSASSPRLEEALHGEGRSVVNVT
jgi:hypothetical protein